MQFPSHVRRKFIPLTMSLIIQKSNLRRGCLLMDRHMKNINFFFEKKKFLGIFYHTCIVNVYWCIMYWHFPYFTLSGCRALRIDLYGVIQVVKIRGEPHIKMYKSTRAWTDGKRPYKGFNMIIWNDSFLITLTLWCCLSTFQPLSCFCLD